LGERIEKKLFVFRPKYPRYPGWAPQALNPHIHYKTLLIPPTSAFYSTRPIQAVQTAMPTSETMATAIAMLAMAEIREKLAGPGVQKDTHAIVLRNSRVPH
jgi:hypothetical protein